MKPEQDLKSQVVSFVSSLNNSLFGQANVNYGASVSLIEANKE